MNMKNNIRDILNEKEESLKKTRLDWLEAATIMGGYDYEGATAHDFISKKEELKNCFEKFNNAKFSYNIFKGYVKYNSQCDDFKKDDYIELENSINSWKRGLPDSQEGVIAVDDLISVDVERLKKLDLDASLEYIFSLYDQKLVADGSYYDFVYACRDVAPSREFTKEDVLVKTK